MNYAFHLTWEELNVELQDQKINEVIEFNYKNNEYSKDRSLEEIQEDGKERMAITAYIKAHLPMYF